VNEEGNSVMKGMIRWWWGWHHGNSFHKVLFHEELSRKEFSKMLKFKLKF